MDEKLKEGLRGLETGPEASEAPPAEDGSAEPEAFHPTVVALRERFGARVLRHEVCAGDEHVVFVDPDGVYEIFEWLREDPGQGYDLLKDVTAVDFGGGRPLQVVYQLWSMAHARELRLKTELPLRALETDSVVPLWHAADWLEREVYDMFGVHFRNHPDLRRILMPESYAEGHPLRKEFPLRGRFTRAEQTRRALTMDVEDFYTPDDLEFMDEVGQTPPDPNAGPGMPNPMPGVGGA